jgi:hypothetical protein
LKGAKDSLGNGEIVVEPLPFIRIFHQKNLCIPSHASKLRKRKKTFLQNDEGA